MSQAPHPLRAALRAHIHENKQLKEFDLINGNRYGASRLAERMGFRRYFLEEHEFQIIQKYRKENPCKKQ